GGAERGLGRVHDRGAAARGGGRGRGRGTTGGDTAVERAAGLRADDTVDAEAVRALVALHRGVGALAEDAVDDEVRTVVVERGLEVLHGSAAGAPAELLGGVEDRRGGGGRGRHLGSLRGGGGRGGSGGRSGLRGTAGEGGAEDDSAEDRCATEAAGCALCVVGGELGAAGDAVRVVLSHGVRFVPSDPGRVLRAVLLWHGRPPAIGESAVRGDGSTLRESPASGHARWQSRSGFLGGSLPTSGRS